MILSGRRLWLPLCLISVLGIVLIALGVLEYRWVSAISETWKLRWMAINISMFLVLAIGMATIIVYAMRAQRLARMQMEFVAGVSHELRTPLAVIAAAADNLAEGVVRTDASVKEYGALVRTECRKLSGLVEQTLKFAATKAPQRPRNVQPLRVREVIEKTISTAQMANQCHDFQIAMGIDEHLPVVWADADALSECLLNLISNALKYGASGKWLGVFARPIETGTGTGIAISIEDRGIGIPESEKAQIFEPFYRGHAARDAQIRGTGLGLSLAKASADSIGARITVESTLGEGSSFIVHIPPAYMNSSTVPVEALVES